MGASSRRVIGSSILMVLIKWVIPLVFGADRVWPSTSWAKAEDPAAIGWSAEKLGKAEEYTQAYAPTAVIIVQDGRVIASSGDVSHKVNVRSVRKSLLSALYGVGVANGRIGLDRTIGELDTDDRAPSLSDTEKQATIRDLLMARSGIYHPAAYEGSDAKTRRPQRNSHNPGSFWYYNNWDFNTLGFIYEKLVGESVFQGFEVRIAQPIGMEDSTAGDGKFVFESSSDYPAYTMRLSARDLARFGWLFLNRGVWSGAQVIPADWVDESTKPWSRGDWGFDYGYLWVLPADAVGEQVSLAGTYMALGYGGQGLAVVPNLRLIVAQLVDVKEGQERIGGGRELVELLHLVASAAGVDDLTPNPEMR
jgi:CubicO group peptidase (beta-lactamase class C family)